MGLVWLSLLFTVPIYIPQSSSTPVVELESSPPQYSHSVKVINPAKKKSFSVRKLRIHTHFTSFEALKDQLVDNFNDLISDPDKLEFGYIGPGHGSRGKQNWIAVDEDVEDMYDEYNSKHRKDVMLWFYAGDLTSEKSTASKRSRSPLGDPKCSQKPKHSTYQTKLDKVESILGSLKQKHAAAYPEEKLRAWAHLIEMEKHSSYDEPPNTPFFAGTGLKSATTNTSSTGVSPSKRLMMRTQCSDQLDKWHTLFRKGMYHPS